MTHKNNLKDLTALMTIMIEKICKISKKKYKRMIMNTLINIFLQSNISKYFNMYQKSFKILDSIKIVMILNNLKMNNYYNSSM
jgi:hypothetical protein